jgi:hypothetical protein
VDWRQARKKAMDRSAWRSLVWTSTPEGRRGRLSKQASKNRHCVYISVYNINNCSADAIYCYALVNISTNSTQCEDSGPLGCNTMLLGEWFLTFQRIIVSSSSTFKKTSWTAWRRKWKQYIPLKCWEPLPKWRSVTYQKTWILNNTTARTSNLAASNLLTKIYQ